MYKLPCGESPALLNNLYSKLVGFQKTLFDEVDEIDDIAQKATLAECSILPLSQIDAIDILVDIADVLADITVYCRSEAMKYGIPLEEVLEIVMDSNESKLGADGEPIYDENGKFLKGSNFYPPESKIKELLQRRINEKT